MPDNDSGQKDEEDEFDPETGEKKEKKGEKKGPMKCKASWSLSQVQKHSLRTLESRSQNE